MKIIFWSSVLIIAAFALLLWILATGSVNARIAAGCRNGEINAEKVLQAARSLGVIRSQRVSDNTMVVEVVTGKWAAVGKDAQISIGIAAYCKVMLPSGRGYAFVEGSLQEPLGSVTDGNWAR